MVMHLRLSCWNKNSLLYFVTWLYPAHKNDYSAYEYCNAAIIIWPPPSTPFFRYMMFSMVTRYASRALCLLCQELHRKIYPTYATLQVAQLKCSRPTLLLLLGRYKLDYKSNYDGNCATLTFVALLMVEIWKWNPFRYHTYRFYYYNISRTMKMGHCHLSVNTEMCV